ncbi:MAG TPA: endonuclease/exonuclease/phosphatase family protein, partial [Thermodesulfobacteriota bacterium]|nr:endonuclease/exonuclease/phosphatase family protein [Thermodesulfobacteriota bacterium]
GPAGETAPGIGAGEATLADVGGDGSAADGVEPAAGDARGGEWALVHWNVKSGFGQPGWIGGCPFAAGTDNPRNAWWSGAMQATLLGLAANAPELAVVTLNEAWNAATPRRIRALLGWAAVAPDTSTGEVAGVGIVARYGFAGRAEVRTLPPCPGSAAEHRLVYAPVYVDARRTRVVYLAATHWQGCEAEGRGTADLLRQWARAGHRPQLLVGDLNEKDPDSPALAPLRGDGFVDAWRVLSGTAAGHTATWNREYGDPPGNLYKRIDYAFSRGVAPVRIARFNHDDTPGTCKESDHAGLLVRYAPPR